jgi:hypothetical protein
MEPPPSAKRVRFERRPIRRTRTKRSQAELAVAKHHLSEWVPDEGCDRPGQIQRLETATFRRSLIARRARRRVAKWARARHLLSIRHDESFVNVLHQIERFEDPNAKAAIVIRNATRDAVREIESIEPGYKSSSRQIKHIALPLRLNREHIYFATFPIGEKLVDHFRLHGSGRYETPSVRFRQRQSVLDLKRA